jgi:phosphoheptose isomerase
MEKIEARIDRSLTESIAAKQDFWKHSREPFFAVGEALVAAVRRGGKVLICGNGGSACDALHFSGEWVNRFYKDRAPLPCIALVADSPLITCIANDYSYDAVFERQVRALGRAGDVLIGITTSGNSKNVLLAFEAAQAAGLTRIALVGGKGGKVVAEQRADHILNVSHTSDTPRVQETHEWILHSLCEYVEAKMFP